MGEGRDFVYFGLKTFVSLIVAFPVDEKKMFLELRFMRVQVSLLYNMGQTEREHSAPNIIMRIQQLTKQSLFALLRMGKLCKIQSQSVHAMGLSAG